MLLTLLYILNRRPISIVYMEVESPFWEGNLTRFTSETTHDLARIMGEPFFLETLPPFSRPIVQSVALGFGMLLLMSSGHLDPPQTSLSFHDMHSVNGFPNLAKIKSKAFA